MTREVVVVSGVRTAIGTCGGSLKDIAPTDLAAQVVRESLVRADVKPPLKDLLPLLNSTSPQVTWAATRVLIAKGDRTLWAISFWTARDGKLVEAIEYFPAPKEPKYESH